MIVLDASIALSWVFPDEHGPLAETVMERVGAEGAMVPSIWVLEVLNALVVGERCGRITPADVTAAVSLLGDLPIETQTNSITGHGAQVLAFARAHNLSTYDAAYLELAARLGAPLATLDGRLAAAARVAGIEILEA